MLCQVLHQRIGQMWFECLCDGGLRISDFGCTEDITLIGNEIDADVCAFLPVGGYLQDGGATQSAMGKEQVFAEFRCVVSTGDDGRTDTAERSRCISED